jgi:hypothetical protein
MRLNCGNDLYYPQHGARILTTSPAWTTIVS